MQNKKKANWGSLASSTLFVADYKLSLSIAFILDVVCFAQQQSNLTAPYSVLG